MRHMAGWFESKDQATLGRITVIQDDVLTQTGTDRFLIPNDLSNIMWGFATGLHLSGARIVTPSLEVAKSDLDILPIGDGADLLTISQPAIWIPPRGIPLDPSETIELQTSEDGSGATTQQGFVVLGDGNDAPMADGEIRSVRAEGTTNLVADTWTSVTLTLESSLEAGRYQLVHFMPFGTTVVAARILPQGGGYRPGMYGFGAASPAHFDFPPDPWYRLGWYNMLEFTHITLPQIQYFATAADSAQTVQMYVIRTGPL